jgi:hypothetical protein
MNKKQLWKRRISLVMAIIAPGLPQILRNKPRLLDGMLFLLGVSALLGAIGFLLLLPIHDDPLEHFFGLSVFDPAEIYPLHINAFAESPETLIPIQPENEPLLIQQPFFWELLYAYISLYVICAGISFWDQWKSGQVRS